MNSSIEQIDTTFANTMNYEEEDSQIHYSFKDIVQESVLDSLHFNKEKHINLFQNVYICIQNIYTLNKKVIEHLDRWKVIYDDLKKKHAKKHYLHCLDIFYFQYKIFLFEMEHFTKYIAFLNHRIYDDYYRLYVSMMESKPDGK
jgi:hypothetical protein